jgi:hypothetical protein
MRWKPSPRVVLRALAALVALELLYLLVANAILFSGVIQREANRDPQSIELGWTRAYSPWPGRVYVSGFWLRLQDPSVQFRLTLVQAKIDVVLWELVHKKFRASRVRAQGVSYRMLTKVEEPTGKERRLAAFPPIEGFESPAVRPNPMPPPPTPEELAALWTVQLDDVDATINELWFLEYRYQGPATVHGGFALSPLRSLWVGPALLQLQGGTLSAGEHPISSAFALRAAVTIAPVDLATSPGLRVLHTLTASIQLDTELENLGAAELYLDGLRTEGRATLSADLQIVDGRLGSGSSVEASLPETKAAVEGYKFAGDTHLKLLVADDQPKVLASLTGALTVPLFGTEFVTAALSGVTAEVVFNDNDLSIGLSLRRLSAALAEARVRDARVITRNVGNLVPLFAPVVLGEGPLVASATAYVIPEYALVRVKHLQLGDAELEGAAVAGALGWTGAAFGHFGKIPLGLRLRNDKLESVPFAVHSWLGVELLKAGIKPGV